MIPVAAIAAVALAVLVAGLWRPWENRRSDTDRGDTQPAAPQCFGGTEQHRNATASAARCLPGIRRRYGAADAD